MRALANGTDNATLREIMLLQELKDDNVINMSEVYVHNGALNLVFELCATDLERVIKARLLLLLLLDPAPQTSLAACTRGMI